MAVVLADEEIDAIHEDGADAGANAWGPLGSPSHRPCPHEDERRAEIWWYAFRQVYAKNNGR